MELYQEIETEKGMVVMDENQNYFNNVDVPSPAAPPEKKGSGKGLFFGGLATGLAIALLVAAVCYIGFGVQNALEQRGQQDGSDKVELQEDSAINANTVRKLQTLEETINRYFFLHEVTDEEMQDGLFKGILASLGDPYSEYYTKEELDSMLEQSEGIYSGIGAVVELDKETGLPKISRVIEGSPAEEAALRANDLVYEVDGASTYGLSLTEAVALIKGPEGTEVELTLIRAGESDYLTLTLTRRKVESPTVEFAMLEEDMAYIQVTEFDDVTVNQFANALDSARASGARGIILDLRGNPGGNLDAVVEMCGMILPEGMIVYTEDKYGHKEEYTCDGKHELELPMTVLVDMNSASAAEIMAGAIKDYGIGTLVGTTTFGKGIVQQIMSFRDGSAIKITISAYYTPKGNNIHGIGIVPDVICEFDGEAYYGSEDRPDNQLEKAKEVLLEEMRK